jgi:hypothetical protein
VVSGASWPEVRRLGRSGAVDHRFEADQTFTGVTRRVEEEIFRPIAFTLRGQFALMGRLLSVEVGDFGQGSQTQTKVARCALRAGCPPLFFN